jgi:hypothetical protein
MELERRSASAAERLYFLAVLVDIRAVFLAKGLFGWT